MSRGDEDFDRPCKARPMLSGAIATCILIAATAAAQADWVHDADAGEAATLFEDHKLAVHCTSPDDLTVYYAIPNDTVVDEIIDEDKLMLMVSMRDDGVFRSYGASTVDYGARLGVGFRGPATRDLARQFSSANKIVVGVALEDHGESFSQYNQTAFPGAGSSKAIRSLLNACGID